MPTPVTEIQGCRLSPLPTLRQMGRNGGFMCVERRLAGSGTRYTAIIEPLPPSLGVCDEECIHGTVVKIADHRYGAQANPNGDWAEMNSTSA